MTKVMTKAVAEIAPADNDADTPTGAFEVVLSAPTLDRDGDTLLPEEWKTPLPDHITFDTDHGMSVATTVGSGVPRVEADGTLRVSGTYSSIPRAQEVRTLVNEGHIRTTSVAFLTEKNAKGAKTAVTRELLNGAFVAVPSNREAVVLSSKGFEAMEEETKAGARNSAADQAAIQAAHDRLIEAGAQCPTDSKSKSMATKSIVGSVEALQDRVTDALEDAYSKNGSYWGWLRGVIPNPAGDGGTVIFQSSSPLVGDPDSWDSATYSQTFTDDGSVVTLTGTATEVDIHEVVAPDADADREQEPGDQTAKAATGDDALELNIRARAMALRAMDSLS